MRKDIPDMAKSEWSLMEGLWIRGRATATQLQTDLKDTQGWAYSTVKTMLDRLVEKGYVTSRRVGNVYEYSPKFPRETVVGRVVDDMLDRFLSGSVAPLVHRLVERRKLSRSEVDQLRDMLDAYDDGESDEGESTE